MVMVMATINCDGGVLLMAMVVIVVRIVAFITILSIISFSRCILVMLNTDKSHSHSRRSIVWHQHLRPGWPAVGGAAPAVPHPASRPAHRPSMSSEAETIGRRQRHCDNIGKLRQHRRRLGRTRNDRPRYV